MAAVRLDKVTKRFGPLTAVRELSFEVNQGEFFCIVGPPGAGKTTTLRLIAGSERPDAGTIHLAGELVSELEPRHRAVAAFFSPVGLQPKRSGFENLATPLRQGKWPEANIHERVSKVADLLGMGPFLHRPLRTYNHAEIQRLGMARTLVEDAPVYLLDEPLRLLDGISRIHGRAGLRRLHHALGQTLIYATDDPLEALALGDRVCVVQQGTVQQIDSPRRVYDRPTSRFVAEFVGSPPMNFVEGSLREVNGRLQFDAGFFRIDVSLHAHLIPSSGAGTEIVLGIRPEHIQIRDEPHADAIPATVDLVEPLGPKTLVRLTSGGVDVHALGEASRSYPIGEAKWLEFDVNRLHLIDRQSEKVLI